MRLAVPFYRQEHPHTCGPACLRMVLAYFGTTMAEPPLAALCNTTPLGTGRLDLAQAATQLGLSAQLVDHLSHSDTRQHPKDGHPIIAVVDAGILYPGVFGFAHAVVIVGMEGARVVYHDPGNAPNLVAPWRRFRPAWDSRSRRGVVVWRA